ncbi:MAG: nuclear transport factor 2 family protein [Rhodospirillaceae bacterium]|nr:nuclear transport factor 2 family protein [Rhodospirillaceae bacterium]
MTRLGLFAAAVLMATSALADPESNYQEALQCSQQMQSGAKLAPDAHRACVIAISTTYIDAEENTLAWEKCLLADDVSRHSLGTPADYKAGNAAKIHTPDSKSVIAAIKNRRWVADGNQAWIEYDGYLKADPSKIGFYVAERFTIENGLIKEIMIGGVLRK